MRDATTSVGRPSPPPAAPAAAGFFETVHAVLGYGLGLRERLARGEQPALEAEQAALIGLLLGESEARRWPDYGGDASGGGAVPRPAAHEDTPAGPFLGARYALVCWLDELFILDSPWSGVWNEHKLEVRLYATNDRAWRFWEQARLAADRGQTDALEVFFLCVMLGFSGDLLEDPAGLAEWVASMRAQIGQARQEAPWRAPAGLEPATRVPPLRGRRALRRMLLVGSAVLLALVPLVALALARRLS